MRAAAVFEVDDMAVGGQLVAAYPEHGAQRPGKRQEEPAIAACALGGLRHLRRRTVVAVVPALRRFGAAPGAHHPAPSQTDLQGDLVDLWITGGQVTGYQPRIIRHRRQQVARAQVARPDPLIPGHPLRRQQRRRPRHQHDLADRRVVGTRASGHDDSPLPALVTGQMREEAVGSAGRIFVSDAEVVAHRVGTAELDDRRPRRLHGVGEQGRQLRRPLFGGRRRRLPSGPGHVVRCFHRALIVPQSRRVRPHRLPARRMGRHL